MFGMEPFSTPPEITYTDKSGIKNVVIIKVNTGSENKEITAAVVSTAVSSKIQQVNSCNE